MARSKGITPFSGNFEPQAAAPLDARQYVETKTDLTNPVTWEALDGNSYTYKGMIVSVYNDTTHENNGVYVLIGDDPTIETNWIAAGGGVNPDDLQWKNEENDLDSNTNQLTPTDELVKRIKLKQDSNGGTQLHLENINTGNNAYASVVATTSNTDYSDQLFFSKFGPNYWVSEFADNALLTSDKTMYVGHYGSGALKLYTADSYSNPITRLEIADGYLKINDDDGNDFAWFTNGRLGINTNTPQSLVSIGAGGEPGTFSVQDITDGAGNIATFRDNDAENIFKAQGKLSDDSLNIEFGDYDEAYGRGTLSLDKDGLYYGDNPVNKNYYRFKADKQGNLDVKDTLTVTKINIRDNNDPNAPVTSLIQERDATNMRRIMFMGEPQNDSFGFIVAPTTTTTSNVNFGVWNTNIDAGGTGTYAGMNLTSGGEFQIYDAGGDIVFRPGNTQWGKIGVNGQTTFDTITNIKFQIEGNDKIDVNSTENRVTIYTPSYKTFKTINDADYNQVKDDHIIYLRQLTGNKVLTLDASPIFGTEIIIKVDDSVGPFSNTVRIDGNGNTIDGQNSMNINTAWQSIRLYFTGTERLIVG